MSWTPRFGFSQAPSLNYSGPLVITSGGTYSGNFRSTDSNTPVIRISTTQPVIIENSTLVGPGTIIDAYNVRANLIVRGTKGYGTTPTANGYAPGRFIEASNPIQLKVENNYMEQTAGMYIYQWGGSGAADQTLTVRYNQAKNIDGRKRGGGEALVQFLQLNQVRSVANMEIAWNQVINEPNNSRVEDNINFSNSGGTAASPTRVHDNYVQGAYPYPATATGFSGTGITTDGDGSTPATTAAFINAYNNQFVSTCNAAMNIAAGHDIHYYNNRMVTSSYLPDGTKLNATYAAVSIFNAYQVPSSVMYNNSVENNTIGFAKDGFSVPYPGRHDLSSGACSPCTGTTHFPNSPITVAMEQNEFTLWQQKLQQNGITVGAAGTNSNPTPTPTPTPAPAPAPTTGGGNTGSTPMSGPANATFFRGINVNGAAVTLDGKNWESSNGAANFQLSGASPFSASSVTLNPNTDAARADMIRASAWGNTINATVSGVTNGSYSVYLYVFEDNNAETYNVLVEGQTVRSGYNSGAAGHWERLGPFTANVTDGNITVGTTGGAANLSGIEIWKNNTTTANQAPTVSLTAASTLTLGQALNLAATAADADGTVAKVEFFSGSTKLGEDTSAPYTLSFTPAAAGSLSLTARATDNAGATTTSSVVTVTVSTSTTTAPSPTAPANATFFRGINVNGPAVTLDGNSWLTSSGNLQLSGASPFTASGLTLNPSTDASRADMIRSAVWGTAINATVPNVANGSYSVYLYVFEDNAAETFNIGVEGQTVRSGYNSGSAGRWERLGPFAANVTDGNISITTSGGAANLSGIEIWKNNTTTTTPTTPSTTRTLFRAVNLNGSAQTIDGISYEDGTTFRNITTNGGKFANQNVTLTPATDAARAQMIRSSVWGDNLNVTVSSVPNGTYEVAYYIWEDNSPETYSATVNGQTLLTNYNSGAAGTWRKTTPVTVTVTNGQIVLQSTGSGHMNVSGLEIFRIQ